MDLLALSVPQQKIAASPAEIRPKQARAWLISLPAANAVAMARQLYQALYAVNRVALTAQNRLELMTLYHEPVAAAGAALQVHLSRLTLPLPPKKAQLADFLRQLEVEMAYGYKLALQELSRARSPWAKPGLALSVAQAIYYLGRVLLRSYQVYRPCPAGVWKEIHALYDYAEQGGRQDDAIEGSAATIAQRYKQALLLGLANPYQLPQNECNQVYAFLAAWAGEAIITDALDVGETSAHFLIDLNADAPPLPFPKDVKISAAAHWRVLDVSALATTVNDLMRRLQKGEPAKQLALGGECVGFACQDMLKRLTRSWGLGARRQYSRARREGRLSLCTGINAIHFFTTGQKPFAQPQDLLGSRVSPPSAVGAEVEPPYVELDSAVTEETTPVEETAWSMPAAVHEVFRVDSWRVRDEGAGGLSLRREGLLGTSARVGDLLGLEDPLLGVWRIGVARWLRSADAQSVEMGVEMLSPHAEAVAIKPVSSDPKAQRESRFTQALSLPAIGALRKPATLLVPRGTFERAQDLYLMSEHQEPRRVRLLTLVERTGSFEHVVFVDMVRS